MRAPFATSSFLERENRRDNCYCQINVKTRDPVRFRSRSSFFVVSFYYLFFPPPFSRGRWRRRRVSGRYLTTTDVNSFTRAQNRSLRCTKQKEKHAAESGQELSTRMVFLTNGSRVANYFFLERRRILSLERRVRVLLRAKTARAQKLRDKYGVERFSTPSRNQAKPPSAGLAAESDVPPSPPPELSTRMVFLTSELVEKEVNLCSCRA